ncbi:hypothetical protein E1B28_003429 [Marasmius oreades]|uniref:Nephrocystin 3-like N-terminal domain-containing protein n=1 Tax=Marasmius oreades TaxID=181124 RepID=A0A9P7UKT5_9AGAR|nr:uncharacterized protein E1B28_003429 [Marasmius oreades]KAG7085895.1 hypothetical protein E1B28_003429 [Marasmius oreades]
MSATERGSSSQSRPGYDSQPFTGLICGLRPDAMSEDRPSSGNSLPTVTIKAVRVEDIPVHRAAELLLTIKYGGIKHKITSWNTSRGLWDAAIQIREPEAKSDFIHVELRQRKSQNLFRSNIVGSGEFEIDHLWKSAREGTHEFRTTITASDHHLNLKIRMMFEVTLSCGSGDCSNSHDNAQPIRQLTDLNDTPSGIRSPPEPRLSPARSILPDTAAETTVIVPSLPPKAPSETLGVTLSNIRPITDMLERLAQVHPIAEVTWFVVSSAYRAITAQYDRDTEIVQLYDAMCKLYEAATKEDVLNRHAEFSALFDAMINQSIECCLFITNYSSGGYLRRLIGNISASEKIQKLNTALSELEARFKDVQLRAVTATVLALRPQLEVLGWNTHLQALRIQQLRPREPCLLGTRRETLLKIMDWIARGEESVMWLSGVAGCGKSSVMASLNNHLISMGCTSRLAAFIRFDRFDLSDPSGFVRTLAYQLGLFDQRLGELIAKAVETRPQIVGHTQLLDQLHVLVLEPLQTCISMQDEGPIVILIDGFDECMQESGGSDSFRQLLALFSDPQTFESFPFVRFVIASRPEDRIRQAFRHRKHIQHFPLDISSKETKADITHYFNVKFSETCSHHPPFAKLCEELNIVEQLSERASGLFIWAATIFRFLDGYPTKQRVNTVLSISPPADALIALTDLYQKILDSIAKEGGGIQNLIVAVFGFIIAAGNIYMSNRACIEGGPALTPSILCHCIRHSGYDMDDSDILLILSKLGSVLRGDLETDKPLYLLHKSFDDFLSDSERSGEWFVDVEKHWSRQLGFSCLSIVHSHILTDTPSYSEVFHYASLNWAPLSATTGWSGIEEIPSFQDLFREMMERHLLRWIYVLHLIKDDWFRSQTHDIHSITFRSLRRLFDTDDKQEIAILTRQTVSFQDRFTDLRVKLITLNRALKAFFLFLCKAGPSTPIYKYYARQFVQIAKGSADFSEILTVIASENTLQSFEERQDSTETFISGIPDNVDELLDNAWNSFFAS